MTVPVDGREAGAQRPLQQGGVRRGRMRLPALAWLYFALAQFPIYLSPQLLKALVRRLRETSAPPS